jgi:hypothetical protein
MPLPPDLLVRHSIITVKGKTNTEYRNDGDTGKYPLERQACLLRNNRELPIFNSWSSHKGFSHQLLPGSTRIPAWMLRRVSPWVSNHCLL